MTNIENKQTVA